MIRWTVALHGYCDALHDPERDHWIILYTAVPGTPDHDALRLLSVIGTQEMTARQ